MRKLVVVASIIGTVCMPSTQFASAKDANLPSLHPPLACLADNKGDLEKCLNMCKYVPFAFGLCM